jgi:RNA polymerase sigma-70 factor (ECF subfamily)
MGSQGADPLGGEASAALLDRARNGDSAALEMLMERYLPRLKRWAAGRVPAWARHATDTQDLVQDTVLAALSHLDGFDYRQEGALQAYFRQSILNRIRTQFRRAAARPQTTALEESQPETSPSPLELAIGTEMVQRYEAALLRLSEPERELVIARVEMGYTNEELAILFGKPTKGAARVAVGRALVRLAEEMGHEG